MSKLNDIALEQANASDASNVSTDEATSIDNTSKSSKNKSIFFLLNNTKSGKKDLSEIRDLESDDEDNSNSSDSSSSSSQKSASSKSNDKGSRSDSYESFRENYAPITSKFQWG